MKNKLVRARTNQTIDCAAKRKGSYGEKYAANDKLA